MIRIPTEDELADAIAGAARAAITALFQARAGGAFYYVSLITTGEGHPPVLTAWSVEALADSAGGDPEAQAELRWSSADSPYYGAGEAHFGGVADLYAARPDAYPGELAVRLRAMERAMATLDAEGLFRSGEERLGVVVGAEVMPADHTNVGRMKRLNPPAAIGRWLKEAAEPEE